MPSNLQVSELQITADGRLRFLWDDSLAPMVELGATVVERASQIEPDAGGGWVADLALSGGPVLGPFKLRAEALAAEQEWLKRNVF